MQAGAACPQASSGTKVTETGFCTVAHPSYTIHSCTQCSPRTHGRTMSARKKTGATQARAARGVSTTANASPKRVERGKAGVEAAAGGDDRADAGEQLLLQWIDVSKACKQRDGVPAFTPRCAHAMALLSTPSAAPEAAGFPSTLALIGGCNESEYFPAEEVRHLLRFPSSCTAFAVFHGVCRAMRVRVCACGPRWLTVAPPVPTV